MTEIIIVKNLTKGEYYLEISNMGMGIIDNELAERFIGRYKHVKPEVYGDAMQWKFTNP